jgi:hypothetical protein
METCKIQLLPYPDGKTFAFTIIDDTDMATLETVRPVYDFLFSLGLRTTKTIWVKNSGRAPAHAGDAGDTLERADYAQYLRELSRRNFEIALHNICSQSAERDHVTAGLERFKEFFGEYPKINVHHEKNRENLYFAFAQTGGARPGPFRSSLFRTLYRMVDGIRGDAPLDNHGCSGEDPKSPYFWGDVCRSKIRYVRSNLFFRELNTLNCNPLMPYTSSETPFVNYWFDSSNGQNAGCFNSILRDEQISRLKSERGCSILYTHFGMGFVSANQGKLELNPESRRRLQAIAGDSDGWYAPTSEILDRLLAFQRVTVLPVRGGTVISNLNPFDLASVTVCAEPHRAFHDLQSGYYTTNEKGTLVLPVLPAGHSLALVHREAEQRARRWYEEQGRDLYLDCRTAASKLRSRLLNYA